ncbi:MAG: hypothetical protein ABFD81_07805 [Syntrophaceae bacterium]
MGIRIPVVLMTLLALLLATGASAKSQLSISMQAEKEVTIDKETKRVKADKVEPGVVIFYTLSYVNSGDEAATNAVLDDPIPKGTVYLAGSAYGEGAEVTFSIDGGKTFKKPSLLTYEVELPGGKVEKRTASPEQYTHIRWTTSTIPAHGSGQVGFQVRVK